MISLKSIRKSMRITAGLMALAVMIGTGSAFASVNIDGCNGTTGPFSSNSGDWLITSDTSINIINDAAALNDILLDANTGVNHIASNTETCDIITGDILGDFRVINTLNNAPINLVSTDPGFVTIRLSNNLTGPNSDNTNTVTVSRDVDVNLVNTATITNNIDQNLTTGRNTLNNNTVAGSLITGDIHVGSTVQNVANSNVGCVGLPAASHQVINADFENDVTGPNSVNTNEADITTNSNFTLDNITSINNSNTFVGDTGDNVIDNNTVVRNIRTGSVMVNFDVLNKAN